MLKSGRPKLKPEQFVRRVPYSIILMILAERMSLGLTTTEKDLLNIGISLPKNKKNMFDRKIEATYLHHVVNRLVEVGLVVRSGKFLKLADKKKVLIARDVDMLIFQAELLDMKPNISVAFPEDWGDSLTEPVMIKTKEQMDLLNKTWAIVVLNEVEKRVQAGIIKVDVKLMNLSEKAFGLLTFNRALQGHLQQLGWIIEEEEGQNIVMKLNASFLKEIGILPTVEMMYSNDGVNMINRDTLRKAVGKLIKEIKGQEEGKVSGSRKRRTTPKEIGTDRKKEIIQKVETMLRPLQTLNGPLIIARMALPISNNGQHSL